MNTCLCYGDRTPRGKIIFLIEAFMGSFIIFPGIFPAIGFLILAFMFIPAALWLEKPMPLGRRLLYFPLLLIPGGAFWFKPMRNVIMYCQEREGKNGKGFIALKFRTMVECSDKLKHQVCQADDPRVTCVGGLLRKTHWDELLQFINILRRQMNLVGPRPRALDFANGHRRVVGKRYDERLSVRPGLTGLAQILQRAEDTDPGMISTCLEYDLYYIKHRSIFYNLAIMGRTALGATGWTLQRVSATLLQEPERHRADEKMPPTLSRPLAAE